VSVRLVDDLGQIWAQNDYEPLGAVVGSPEAGAGSGPWRATDRFGLLVPAGTPPGRYRVELVVLPQGGERPLTAATGSGESTSSVPLFEMEVAPSDRPLSPERLPITERQSVDLGDGLRFLGYTLDTATLTPGSLRRVNLFWQATVQPSSDYTAFVQLLGKSGAPVAAWEAAPGAAYPTSEWAPGTLMRTQAILRPGAEVPDGSYPVIAGMYRPADGMRLKTAAGKDSLSLASLTVKGRPHEMEAAKVVPASSTRADVTFGDVARLVASEGPPNALSPNGSAAVILYWQSLGSTQIPYTVFLHLVDEQTNAVIGYGDGEPANGEYPTTGWLKGEYLADPHNVTFSGATAQGQPVRIEIGLYDPATGQRLTLPDGSDAFVVWRGQMGG
jgi:hypothetical protein